MSPHSDFSTRHTPRSPSRTESRSRVTQDDEKWNDTPSSCAPVVLQVPFGDEKDGVPTRGRPKQITNLSRRWVTRRKGVLNRPPNPRFPSSFLLVAAVEVVVAAVSFVSLSQITYEKIVRRSVKDIRSHKLTMWPRHSVHKHG